MLVLVHIQNVLCTQGVDSFLDVELYGFNRDGMGPMLQPGLFSSYL